MSVYSKYSIPMAKLVFSSSDNGAAHLYSWFSNDVATRDRVLKEYTYLKAYLVVAKLTAIEGYEDIGIEIVKEMYSVLNDAFNDDVIGYGCNIYELGDRVAEYIENSDYSNLNTVTREFNDVIGIDVLVFNNVGIMDMHNVVCFIDNQISNVLVACSRKQKSSGCLSTIACMLLLFIVLCVL